MDRRKKRSRHALSRSLTSLLRERPLARIRAEEVADRADVARSTFYAHAHGVEPLLFEVLEQVVSALVVNRLSLDDGRVKLPLLPFLEHVHEERALFTRLMHDPGPAVLAHRIQRPLARGVVEKLERLLPASAKRRGVTAMVGASIAGAVCALIIEWAAGGMAKSPAEVDALFQELVVSGMNDWIVSSMV